MRNCCLGSFAANDPPSQLRNGSYEDEKPRPPGTSYSSARAALLLLTAQISLAGSATWLLSPQDSAWENAQQLDGRWAAKWAVRYRDVRSLLADRREHLDVCGGEQHRVRLQLQLFHLQHLAGGRGGPGGELIFSGTGVRNNSNVLQTFVAGDRGQIIFNNTSTAASDQMPLLTRCRSRP